MDRSAVWDGAGERLGRIVDEVNAADSGSFELGAWNREGVVELSATGGRAQDILLAGLQGVLAAARGDDPAPAAPEEAATAAAPIRGQGTDLSGVFAELAADLLAQLDANGLGLEHVRLDGLLQTDDGGYSAWGYAIGVAAAAPPPLEVSLDGVPTVRPTADGFVLRCILRRGSGGPPPGSPRSRPDAR